MSPVGHACAALALLAWASGAAAQGGNVDEGGPRDFNALVGQEERGRAACTSGLPEQIRAALCDTASGSATGEAMTAMREAEARHFGQGVLRVVALAQGALVAVALIALLGAGASMIGTSRIAGGRVTGILIATMIGCGAGAVVGFFAEEGGSAVVQGAYGV